MKTIIIRLGLGTGFANSGCMVAIGYYFPKRSSFVSGICTCGSGLGIFVLPNLIRYLIDQHTLRGAFLIMGGIMFNLCVFGMLLRPSQFERERKHGIGQSSSTFRALCHSCLQFPEIAANASFLFFALSTFSFSMAISTLYLYLPDYFYTQGATLQESSFALSASGIGSIISRILAGLAADDKDIGCDIFYTCLPSVLAILTLLVPFFSMTNAGRIAYSFLAGLYIGPCFVMFNPIVLEILGVNHFASGIGFVNLFCGVGLLLGPPIAGRFSNTSTSTQNYKTRFINVCA